LVYSALVLIEVLLFEPLLVLGMVLLVAKPLLVVSVPRVEHLFAKVARRTWRRNTSHCGVPSIVPAANPIRAANPYTIASLGSGGAEPPVSAPALMRVVGNMPNVQAINAPAAVARTHAHQFMLGKGPRSTSHCAVPTTVPSMRVPAKTAAATVVRATRTPGAFR
jgi:hypothetical protein